MDADSQLIDTLHKTVANAVSRMEMHTDHADRRALFHEYKEWLAEDVSEEVWAIPANWNYDSIDIYF